MLFAYYFGKQNMSYVEIGALSLIIMCVVAHLMYLIHTLGNFAISTMQRNTGNPNFIAPHIDLAKARGEFIVTTLSFALMTTISMILPKCDFNYCIALTAGGSWAGVAILWAMAVPHMTRSLLGQLLLVAAGMAPFAVSMVMIYNYEY